MEGCICKDSPGFLGPEEESVCQPFVIAERYSGYGRIGIDAGYVCRAEERRTGRFRIIVELDIVIVSADNQIEIFACIESEVDRFLDIPVVKIRWGEKVRHVTAVEVEPRQQLGYRIAGYRAQFADAGIQFELQRAFMLPIVEIEDIASHFAKPCRPGVPTGSHIVECNVLDRREDHPTSVEGVGVIVGQRGRKGVGKVEFQLRPDGLLPQRQASAIELARGRTTGNLVVAIGVPQRAGQAEADLVAERTGDGNAPAIVVELRIGRLDRALQFAARIDGVDQDRAAGRVATIERALRALEDLDVLNVGQIHVEDLRGCFIETVNEHGHVVLIGTGGERSDAADRRLGIGTALVDLEAGGHVRQIANGVDARTGQRRRRNHLHRHRHFFELFIAPLGSNNDVVAVGLVRRSALRQGWRGPQRHGQRSAAQQHGHIQPISQNSAH